MGACCKRSTLESKDEFQEYESKPEQPQKQNTEDQKQESQQQQVVMKPTTQGKDLLEIDIYFQCFDQSCLMCKDCIFFHSCGGCAKLGVDGMIRCDQGCDQFSILDAVFDCKYRKVKSKNAYCIFFQSDKNIKNQLQFAELLNRGLENLNKKDCLEFQFQVTQYPFYWNFLTN